MKKILIQTIIIFLSSSMRVFLMGGNMNDNDTTVYEALATSTNRKPSPDNCDSSWDSTTCPRIAVVTSGASSS